MSHSIGHDFIKLLRQESMRLNPLNNGEYYALHVRRGDFQYAPVKISAEKIVANLHYLNGNFICIILFSIDRYHQLF